MDARQLATASPEDRDSLTRERDGLWSKAEESMRRAQEVLLAGHVSSTDPDYRMVMIGMGNIIFGREVGVSNEEKTGYYRQALLSYRMPRRFFLMTHGLSCIRGSATSGL